jgi:Zn-finger nucleic acid-binding protein
MEIVKFDDVEVDRCTGCGGIWFDARERERLEAKRGSEAIDTGSADVGKQQNTNDRIACPRCTSRMVRMIDPKHPRLWFEQCAVCGGAYLDAGEFRDSRDHSVGAFFRDLFAKPRT